MSRRVVFVVAPVTAVLVAALAACSSGPPVAGSSAASVTAGSPAATGSTASPTASAATSSTPSPAQSAVTVSPTPAGSTVACAENQLGAVEVRHGAEASSPFSVIKVVNGTRQACTLSGYPGPAFWQVGGGKLVKLPLKVTRGSTREVRDPGPTRFLVPPGGSAWFAVSTGTGYGGRMRSLTYFTFYPTARTTGVGVLCGVNLATNSPNPIPVTVTAFAPGPPPTA